MKTLTIAPAIALASAIGLSITATPTFAGETRQVSVSFADLNLESAEGRATLEHRLEKAAREACDYDNVTTGSRLRTNEQITCYKQARSRTNEQMAQILEKVGLGG